MYLLESERLEPPRGSLAHVSCEIPAVGDDGDGLAQSARRFRGKLAKWKAHRPWQVLLLELCARQHFDQLRTLSDEPPQHISLDWRGHTTKA